MNIQIFISVLMNRVFADLRKRIAKTRWSEGVSFKGWKHGTHLLKLSAR